MLQAFTWNGFEDGTTWLGGMWSGSTTQQGDFATLVYRAQLYGFNAVRIPFRWGQTPRKAVLCMVKIVHPRYGIWLPDATFLDEQCC